MVYALVLIGLFVACQLIDGALNYSAEREAKRPVNRLLGWLHRVICGEDHEPLQEKD